MADVEQLLRNALRPVEPPTSLSETFEERLTEIADAAAEELADWELSTMSDPRNWARPATAVVAGAAAGGALALVRLRRNQKQRNARRLGAFEQAVRDFAEEARRRV